MFKTADAMKRFHYFLFQRLFKKIGSWKVYVKLLRILQIRILSLKGKKSPFKDKDVRYKI